MALALVGVRPGAAPNVAAALGASLGWSAVPSPVGRPEAAREYSAAPRRVLVVQQRAGAVRKAPALAARKPGGWPGHVQPCAAAIAACARQEQDGLTDICRPARSLNLSRQAMPLSRVLPTVFATWLYVAFALSASLRDCLTPAGFGLARSADGSRGPRHSGYDERSIGQR